MANSASDILREKMTEAKRAAVESDNKFDSMRPDIIARAVKLAVGQICAAAEKKAARGESSLSTFEARNESWEQRGVLGYGCPHTVTEYYHYITEWWYSDISRHISGMRADEYQHAGGSWIGTRRREEPTRYESAELNARAKEIIESLLGYDPGLKERYWDISQLLFADENSRKFNHQVADALKKEGFKVNLSPEGYLEEVSWD